MGKIKEEKLSLKRRDLVNGSESRTFLEMGQQAEATVNALVNVASLMIVTPFNEPGI